MDAFKLIAKKLSGELTATEEVKFDTWYQADDKNQKLYEKLHNIWQRIQTRNPQNPPDLEQEWLKLKKRIKTNS